MDTILLDHQLQEMFLFEDSSFPIKYYVDNLEQWADYQVPLHWHLGYEIFSAIYQDIEVQIGQKHLRLLKGESILIGAEQMHSYRMTEVGKCCLCPNIVFADEVLAPMTSTVFKKYFAPVLNNQDLPYLILSSTVEWQKPLLNHLFEIYGLLSENENVNDNSTERCVIKPIESACPEIEIHQKLISIFQILYCHQNELSHINSSKGNQQTQIRIQKMLRYIQEHFAEEISLENLADFAGISRSEAGRFFKKYYAQSPMGYVTLYRLKYAQELLAKSSLTINEIAYRCGFKDNSYFVKVFKKHLKQTPSEYRKKNL